MITIVLPCSRPEYLDKVFHALEALNTGREQVNLLTITDGSNELYVDVRNRTEQSKFDHRLAIQYKSDRPPRKYDLLNRRYRIAEIHNQLRRVINDTDYIFGIEDDTIIPSDALKRLMLGFADHPHAGIIQGTELGRHGLLHVGAWRVDDIYAPQNIISIEGNRDSHGLAEIDTGGMFCFLTKAENYLNHEFKPFDNNGFGPDFDWTLNLRQQGFKNYNDFDLRCVHKSERGDLSINSADPIVVRFKKNNVGRWRQQNVL